MLERHDAHDYGEERVTRGIRKNEDYKRHLLLYFLIALCVPAESKNFRI